jgi:uncharacterized cupredoxin-like copper-binding protein
MQGILFVLGIVAGATNFAHSKDKSASSHPAHHEEQPEFGREGKAADVTRGIAVEMKDQFVFVPSKLEVKAGETVRIVIRNSGALMHEWVLGTAREIEEHAEQMRRFPNMEHDKPQQVRVPPGDVRELVWQFDRPGTFTFACLQPGHHEAGMKGLVEVK